MVQLMDLPDVVLLLILVKLPMWKILQLAGLCHRLNHLKHVCFNTKFTHLRLFGGSTVNKFCFGHETANFFQLKDAYFDLIIRFGNEDIETLSYMLARHSCPFITLNEDWHVENVDQIDRLAQVLPKVTHLTVVSFDKIFISNCYHRLFANWPKLKSLKLLNNRTNDRLISEQMFPVMNSLAHLEHLQIEVEKLFENPVTTFGPLLSRGKLKTFICSHTSHEMKVINGRRTNLIDRTVWNGPNEMIQALEDELDTFGLSRYKMNNTEAATHVTNRALLRKFKYFQGSMYLDRRMTNLAKWNLTDWTALQCVHLVVSSTNPFTKTALKRILTHLAVLTNLTELHLNLFSRISKDDLLSPEMFHKLPRLVSVQKFQIECLFEPHQCLPLLAGAFPNANELAFRLWALLNTENDNFVGYFERRAHLGKLCGACKQTMKRAIDKYGHNIASFHWFLEQDRPGPSYKLIPKVKLFTKEVAGRIRPNFDYIPID